VVPTALPLPLSAVTAGSGEVFAFLRFFNRPD
jgi:hypothetical protein